MRMVYSEALMDHFDHPRFVGRLDDAAVDVGTGMAGSPDSGGVLCIQIQLGEDGQVTDTRFKAYGPPALIAAGSWLAEAMRDKSLSQAGALNHQPIVTALALSPAQMYCAMLAEEAIRAAIHDYKTKQRAYV